MLWVGLSGGIGSGKSTVSSVLARHGAVVIDADRLAREVVEPGTPGLAAIVQRFGPGILTDQGELDRPALGRVVFAEVDARGDLEAMTHPLIAERTKELLDSVPEHSIVVHDVPLLVELGYAPRYHLVVIVAAAAQTRLDRLVSLRGMDRGEAQDRIHAQASDADRRAVADVWLENEGTVRQLEGAAEELYADRLAPYLANLVGGRGVLAGGVPEPAEVARLSHRLAYLLGEELDGPLEIDTGTDSLLVGLRPGTSPEQVADRLGKGGFPLVGDAQHAAADPARPVLLTVREHTVSVSG